PYVGETSSSFKLRTNRLGTAEAKCLFVECSLPEATKVRFDEDNHGVRSLSKDLPHRLYRSDVISNRVRQAGTRMERGQQHHTALLNSIAELRSPPHDVIDGNISIDGIRKEISEARP